MFTNSNLAALLLLLLLLLLHSQVVFFLCSIGGHETKANSRPYMVLLHRNIGAETEFCSGFLLNEDFVLTAAHCKARSYVAFLGLHTVGQNEGVQNIAVMDDFVYDPQYVIPYDLMLLKLSSKAKFTKQVKPIDLAEQDDGSLPGKCSVAGWGKISFNSNYLSNKLMEVDVTLINSESCPQEYFYCSAGQAGPFKGDSGSPLVCEDQKAYGLASHMFKQQNGEPEFRFTKIPKYIDWINSIMNKNK